MKKILSYGLMMSGLALADTSMANNWYVGAGLGWTSGKAGTNIQALDRNPNPYRSQQFKESLSSNATLTSIFGGHTFHRSKFDWYLQARGFLDNADLKKTVKFDTTIVTITDASAAMRRLGTLAFDVGVTKNYKQFDVSLQLGALLSKYEVKFSERTFMEKGTQYVWGIAPGIGVEKDLGFARLGLKYEYQVYAPIKYMSTDKDADRDYAIRSKPRYHSVMLTARKVI